MYFLSDIDPALFIYLSFKLGELKKKEMKINMTKTAVNNSNSLLNYKRTITIKEFQVNSTRLFQAIF